MRGDEYAEDSSDEEVGLHSAGAGGSGLVRPEWVSWPLAGCRSGRAILGSGPRDCGSVCVSTPGGTVLGLAQQPMPRSWLWACLGGLADTGVPVCSVGLCAHSGWARGTPHQPACSSPRREAWVPPLPGVEDSGTVSTLQKTGGLDAPSLPLRRRPMGPQSGYPSQVGGVKMTASSGLGCSVWPQSP